MSVGLPLSFPEEEVQISSFFAAHLAVLFGAHVIAVHSEPDFQSFADVEASQLTVEAGFVAVLQS